MDGLKSRSTPESSDDNSNYNALVSVLFELLVGTESQPNNHIQNIKQVNTDMYMHNVLSARDFNYDTQEESHCGCTAVEVYTAVTLLSTLMSQRRQLLLV